MHCSNCSLYNCMLCCIRKHNAFLGAVSLWLFPWKEDFSSSFFCRIMSDCVERAELGMRGSPPPTWSFLFPLPLVKITLSPLVHWQLMTSPDADRSNVIPRLQCQLLWSWEKIQILRAACFATAALILDCFGVCVWGKLYCVTCLIVDV